MTNSELWTWTTRDAASQNDLTGFEVEASDGHIGKVDEATYETGASCLVVDTGFWIFGKKRMIPAGAIRELDLANNKIVVSMTKDQIKDAPDYDEAQRDLDDYRQRHTDYYDDYYSSGL
jgi:hypothetical protein